MNSHFIPRHRRKVLFAASVVLASIAATVYYLGTFGEIGDHFETYSALRVTHFKGMDYFSEDFTQARRKFRQAAKHAGATLESIPHPKSRGPNGEALSIEVAFFGPAEAKNCLVVISGTHGVEGFAGSAIQVGLCEKLASFDLSGTSSVLMIHALNPYGMAHRRRFNENNIDLNRNFVNHSQPYPTNQHYEELSSAIAPESVSFWSEVHSWWRLLTFRFRHGKDALRSAITQGQYAHPDGLFYGGDQAAWSNTTLRSITNRYLSQAEQVVVVDVHTGLGDFGAYEIIMNDPPSSDAYQRATSIWDTRVKSTIPSELDESRSESAHLMGTLKRGIAAELPLQITAVSLEFGTIPRTGVFKAVRAENWLHHHGRQDDPRAKRIKQSLLRAFYPDSLEWKMAVWVQGHDVIEEALQWLAAEP